MKNSKLKTNNWVSSWKFQILSRTINQEYNDRHNEMKNTHFWSLRCWSQLEKRARFSLDSRVQLTLTQPTLTKDDPENLRPVRPLTWVVKTVSAAAEQNPDMTGEEIRSTRNPGFFLKSEKVDWHHHIPSLVGTSQVLIEDWINDWIFIIEFYHLSHQN